METVLFIYGISLIATFSMLSLQSYNEWLNKKDNIIPFIIFMSFNISTIILFILSFVN